MPNFVAFFTVVVFLLAAAPALVPPVLAAPGDSPPAADRPAADRPAAGRPAADRPAADRSTPGERAGRPPGGLMRYDANKDGVVDRAEWRAGQEARFNRLDSNRDGKLTQEELFARTPASGNSVLAS